MSLVNLSSTVDGFNNQLITLLMPFAGEYSARGAFISSGDPTEVPNVAANVQPGSTGVILRFAPEGERTEEYVEVIFTSIVDTVLETLSQPACKMIYRGLIWKLIAIPGDWRDNGHMECLFQNTKKVYASGDE